VLSVYPIADGDTQSPSYVENAMAKPLSRAGMQWFFRHYPRAPADLRDPRISLVRASLRGLPPTTIVNAQIDPLRSDGEELATALRAAGVRVDRRVWNGVTHEFFGMGAVVDKAKEAVQYGAAGLRRGFGT
jgi:acetyl esterase/lipase